MGAAWAVMAAYFVLGFFGQLLKVPTWVQDLSPFQQMPHLPAGTLTLLLLAAELDETIYPKGIKITDREMRDLENQHITRHDFHGEWNYRVSPAT